MPARKQQRRGLQNFKNERNEVFVVFLERLNKNPLL